MHKQFHWGNLQAREPWLRITNIFQCLDIVCYTSWDGQNITGTMVKPDVEKVAQWIDFSDSFGFFLQKYLAVDICAYFSIH